MRARFWKRYQPTSLRDALAKAKDYARERHNLSVERIADLMGLADHWAIYKWIESGRFPAVLLPAYENVCGIDLATRWLAATQHKLLVAMPVGRAADAADLVQLGSGFQHALQLLSDFYKSEGATDPQAVLDALRGHLEAVAYHHHNVAGFAEPQLELAE
ncbi:MAG: hypothetical protein EPN34_03170 [Burkholderiaceae bacterium]|nr:MAG: hypothetical protein EPN34_03170 [Burkholderiaceae bacterium]